VRSKTRRIVVVEDENAIATAIAAWLRAKTLR